MSVDVPPHPRPEKTTKRVRKSQLRVVLDTNALYVAPNNIGSASDLIREEIANVISDAKHPDLDILWYLPEIIRHERQYQMQTEALKLRSAINRIERLLDHNLALSDRLLLDHVKTKIDDKETQLGLQEIKLDHSLVDWSNLVHAAAYRNPPFAAGEKEKGFRDALVAESFLQLLASSPKSPALCRVVLVTSDVLLTQAVKGRIADSSNASVLANAEELKGLINTLVSNVKEDFIALIKPKAAKLFFVSSDDKETVFYREKIRERLSEKFKTELEKSPQGTMFRQNGTWFIIPPNFSKKVGRRVFWTSRIETEFEAGTLTTDDDARAGQLGQLSDLLWPSPPQGVPAAKALTYANLVPMATGLESPHFINFSESTATYTPPKRVVSHKGRDIYEVLWSTEVAMSNELKKPVIESIAHVEFNCQPIS